MDVVIKQPGSDQEWQQYYELRWLLLRAPWQQPRGSEKDDIEDQATHRAAFMGDEIIGVGRLHVVNNRLAQIRYMAVAEAQRNKGIGRMILKSLETAAQRQGIQTIQLNAREIAIPFYLKFDYQVIEPADTLFGSIKHMRMQKNL